MRKLNKKRISLGIAAAILLLALAFYAWYTKPVTLSELYPMLELDKCTQIQGYYEIGTQAEPSEFTIAKNSGEFETLYNLFYEQRYCRSLRDVFPRGTRIHRTEPDDFQWDVHFVFEHVEFPDGSTGSGAMLHFTNWYGAFDIHFNGETHAYQVSDQERWGVQVLDTIQ